MLRDMRFSLLATGWGGSLTTSAASNRSIAVCRGSFSATVQRGEHGPGLTIIKDPQHDEPRITPVKRASPESANRPSVVTGMCFMVTA